MEPGKLPPLKKGRSLGTRKLTIKEKFEQTL